MGWEQFRALRIDPSKDPRIKRTYSVTGDILSFKICPRQYGMIHHRGFKPAHTIQIWFGLTVHQVLNKLHMQYSGLINTSKRGKIPTDEDVKYYFDQVTRGLSAVGIRAMNDAEKDLALEVITKFNQIEGAELYPNIIETECRFQNNLEDYILEGVVDLLKCSENPEETLPPDYDNVEIWDYKASRNPAIKSKTSRVDLRKLQKYHYQMLVYAQLYRLKTGKYPRCGRLYFMNELRGEAPTGVKRKKAIYTLHFTDPQIQHEIDLAMEDFHHTVHTIEGCRDRDRWASPPKDEIHDKDTCDGCDLRWNCPSVKYAPRYP